jgi:hypothetical protein
MGQRDRTSFHSGQQSQRRRRGVTGAGGYVDNASRRKTFCVISREKTQTQSLTFSLNPHF